MTCLCQNTSLRILDHQPPRILPYLNRTVVRAIGDSVCRLYDLPRLSFLALLETVAEHHIVFILRRRHDGRREHPDAGRPWRDKLDGKPEIRIVVVSSVREVEHLHPHRPVAIEVKGLSR